MTSSPTDINAVRVANEAFNALLQSGEPVSTPAKRCLARTSERSWTQKIILEWEKKELQAVVSARKACLSGKRKIIDGESLISTVEIKLNGVREAERVTQEKWAKRQKVSKKCRFKARRESSDESEVESDDSNEDVVETMDCIEVQF